MCGQLQASTALRVLQPLLSALRWGWAFTVLSNAVDQQLFLLLADGFWFYPGCLSYSGHKDFYFVFFQNVDEKHGLFTMFLFVT